MLQMAQRKASVQGAQSRATNPVLTESVPGPDYGSELLEKRHRVVKEGDQHGRGEDSHHARVTDQSVIDRLKLENRIDDRKYAAALRLLDSFTRAGMSPLLTIDFSRAGSGRAMKDWTASQLAARESTNAALKAIAPLNDVVWDIVLCDRTLTDTGLARQWPKRAAFVILDLGLEALANHYDSLEKQR